MDFMNLNQCAHGDREFGVHHEPDAGGPTRWSPATGRIRRSSTALNAWSRAAAGRHDWQGPSSPASATTCARSPSPKATRSRPKCNSAISVNTYGVGDLVEAIGAGRRRRSVDTLANEYEDSYRPPRCGRWRTARLAARAARIELGLAVSWRMATSKASPTPSKTCLAEAAPRHRRPTADGRRVWLRRRRRLENSRASAPCKVMAAGLPGGTPSWRTTPITWSRPRAGPGRPHAGDLRVRRRRDPAMRDRAPVSGAARDPVRLVFNAAAGPAVVANWLDMGNRFRLVLNEIEVVDPPEDLPRLPSRAGDLAACTRPGDFR